MRAYFSRRSFNLMAGSLLLAQPLVARADTPKRGGTLKFLVEPEPTSLVPIADTTGANVMISAKVTEGLFNYGLDFSLRPCLATGLQTSADGKEMTFTLRQGVKWHDGQPFTSADVAFSIETLKKYHPRGKATYANVSEIRTPDDHTVVLILSLPAPYLVNALAGQESPIIPRHIYDSSNPLANPHNNAPVGTGPFVFKEWQKGNFIILERNPDYWDQPKPYLDRIIVRTIPDAAARSVALETGEVDIGGEYLVPLSDMGRLGSLPQLGIETQGYAYSPNVHRIEFNLDNQYFKDLRVRQAVAHAINKDILLRTVWYGFGVVTTGPIHPDVARFYTADVVKYAFDPATAEKLLDEAGFHRGEDGVRFSVMHDPLPIGLMHVQTGEYIKQALGKVGIKVTLRSQDMAGYIKRVFTDRQFDFTNGAMTNGPDPTLGVQRFYWSKNFRPGVPFSNASHYSNPEVDRLLEAAQSDMDLHKRAEDFYGFQRIVVQDLPDITPIAVKLFTIYNKKVKNHTLTADGIHCNLADVYIDS
jgi:peptide/nickel transport system substrate-binding protein